MASTVLPVVMGSVPDGIEETGYRDTPGTVLPLLALMAVILMLGLWIPLPLQGLLRDAANLLGGNR
jgi:hydrogenase-4 component F